MVQRVKGIKMITATDVLEKAFAKFGPNGEHWIKDAFGTNEKGEEQEPYVNYCSYGAYNEALDELDIGPNEQSLRDVVRDVDLFLDQAVCEYTGTGKGKESNIINYNDDEHTTWEDIKAVWQIAIRLSKASMVPQQ